MSATNVIRKADAVHVLTDGVLSNWIDGRIQSTALCHKVWQLPHLNAVVSVRGWALLGPHLQTLISTGASTFDELRLKVVDLIKETIEFNRQQFGQSFQQWFDVIVAGWTEAGEPSSYIVGNHDTYGWPAWTVTDLGDFAVLPADADMNARIQAAFPHVHSAADFDPEVDGVALVDMQRENPEHGIGGFVQLTTIRPDLITTKILHRWD
ncbi:hypothetical protein [Aureimonas glaciei]|uniref:Uncharacterized protein n=1 Tax=Aureimonas glaciei TaxID=1776957 RepID=A0A916YFF8_9HYPH|nr:hypothetical protein [Aureimonas glaciei]GGD42532.1 hypothetical protein GCM10011335_51530 [Aureimonas glaciei]